MACCLLSVWAAYDLGVLGSDPFILSLTNCLLGPAALSLPLPPRPLLDSPSSNLQPSINFRTAGYVGWMVLWHLVGNDKYIQMFNWVAVSHDVVQAALVLSLWHSNIYFNLQFLSWLWPIPSNSAKSAALRSSSHRPFSRQSRVFRPTTTHQQLLGPFTLGGSYMTNIAHAPIGYNPIHNLFSLSNRTMGHYLPPNE